MSFLYIFSFFPSSRNVLSIILESRLFCEEKAELRFHRLRGVDFGLLFEVITMRNTVFLWGLVVEEQIKSSFPWSVGR